jgi:hypothetical protein
LGKCDLSQYLGLTVRIELRRRSRHSVHTGVLVDFRDNECKLRRTDGRYIWIKKPNQFLDTIEIKDTREGK